MTNYEELQFAHYTLDQLIGQGGFADVYRAWDTHLDRMVAIKVPRKNAGENELQKFSQEACIMAQLKHPNIVTVFTLNFVEVLDGNTYRKIPYLVMDYAPNGSLADRHPHGERLPIDTIMDYLTQITDALEYIHNFWLDNYRLVHLDIKPENMLIGANNEILISDFGIAKFIQDTPPQIALPFLPGQPGTAVYIAPEQLRGHLSPAADQYALGIILYEWLTGTYPFYGTNTDIIQQKLHISPPSLQTIAPYISLAIDQVILKALRKNPNTRFKSVRDLLIALDEARRPSFPRSLITFIQGRY